MNAMKASNAYDLLMLVWPLMAWNGWAINRSSNNPVVLNCSRTSQLMPQQESNFLRRKVNSDCAVTIFVSNTDRSSSSSSRRTGRTDEYSSIFSSITCRCKVSRGLLSFTDLLLLQSVFHLAILTTQTQAIDTS